MTTIIIVPDGAEVQTNQSYKSITRTDDVVNLVANDDDNKDSKLPSLIDQSFHYGNLLSVGVSMQCSGVSLRGNISQTKAQRLPRSSLATLMGTEFRGNTTPI